MAKDPAQRFPRAGDLAAAARAALRVTPVGAVLGWVPPPAPDTGPARPSWWRRFRVPIAAAGVAVAVAGTAVFAVVARNTTDVPQAGAPPATTAAEPVDVPAGTVTGAGASSVAAAMEVWIAGFVREQPQATVGYDPTGSGAGRDLFIEGRVPFAASDVYLDEEEVPAAEQRCGGEVVELPAYLTQIAVIFNLPGFDRLNLRPATLAGIFNQQIVNWSAPLIAADNPGVALPDLAITPVSRSLDTGATEAFTEYLTATAPASWPYEASGEWPVAGGEQAEGSSGVLAVTEAFPGTISYVDAALTGSVGVAGIGVGGQFVVPDPASVSAMIEASPRAPGRGPYDFAYDLARDTGVAGAYPIITVSYLLACARYDDAVTGDLTRAFVAYVTGSAAQAESAEVAGSSPLSDTLRELFRPAVEAIGRSG